MMICFSGNIHRSKMDDDWRGTETHRLAAARVAACSAWRYRSLAPLRSAVESMLNHIVMGGTPIAGWFVMENPMKLGLMTGGSPMTQETSI